MPRKPKQAFDHLSQVERDIVGSPDDYDWEEALDLPARGPQTTQVSVRIERTLLARLQMLARQQAVTVSDVARDALLRYAAAGGPQVVSNLNVSFATDAALLVRVEGGEAEVSPNRRTGTPDEWTVAPVTTA